jgi:hypothetical protein
MPQWTNRPPADASSNSYRIRRTPSGSPITAIVTCDDVVGCNTHFFKGRTVPCEQPDCEACNEGLAWRFHAYVSALDTASNECFLFECTAQVAETFFSYRQQYATLRGCLFRARRATRHPNGRVLLEVKPVDLTQRKIPDEPNIKKMLCQLWNVPYNEVIEADHHRPCRRLHKNRTQPDELEGNGHLTPKHVLDP